MEDEEDKFKGLLYSPEVLGGIGLLTQGLSGAAPSAALPSLLQGMQTASLFKKQKLADEKQKLIKEYGDQVPADKKPEFLIAPLKYLDKYVFNKDKASKFETFLSEDGKDKVTINTSTKSGLAKATDLTDNKGYDKISQSITGKSTSDLSKGAGTEVDKSIVSGNLLLGELKYTQDVFRDEFVTVPGQLKYEAFKKIERLNPNALDQTQKQYIAGYSRWEQASLQYFNQYRKLITGVAAGEKEIGWLESSIPSAKDSPSIYRAKIKNQIAIQERVIENARKFKKFGTGELYSYGKNAEGETVKQYSDEFLDYMKKNKIAPTGKEIDSLVTTMKIQYGDSWEQIKPELNRMYAGLDWEDIYTKYINIK